ncbi:serine hydrolase domain-containing protein [Roseiterribacter gracilis]|uniref:Esterase n=1 Tax=Roseiterribacter gracilis TaxID=2812848 RepID=A0A8S8XA31_9PROT|nr:esterase [Rhodospirillales bacterium TMPK1]
MIDGHAEDRFSAVREEFARNFAERGEVGAAVCVYENGRNVVDLWGGIADPKTGAAWQRDTIVCMMSVGKAMAAICVLQLIDRGKIELGAPMARYWPEFAQAGKAKITVEQVLGGLAALIYAEHAPPGSMMDWDAQVRALELQAPVWEPGTRGAYHSMTAGILFGELVRRVDGRTFDRYWREEVANPLGVDYALGLNDDEMARVAPMIPNPGSVTLNAIADPTSKLGKAWRSMPRTPDFFNSDEYRRGVFPSGNGHGNARAIARVYAALAQGGTLDGVTILSSSVIEEARTQRWDEICGMTDRPFRYGLGFMLSKPPLVPFGDNPRAFGQPGAGGALGFADPERGIAFSFSPNFMCSGAGLGDRCAALITATFASVA